MNVAQMLPLITKLGEYMKLAIDHYAVLKATGADADPAVLAVFLSEKMRSWDPKVGRVSVLDGDTRDAAARFLAGVAVNLANGGGAK